MEHPEADASGTHKADSFKESLPPNLLEVRVQVRPVFVPDLHQPLHFLFLLQEKAAHSFELLDHPRDLAIVPFPDAAFVRLDALVGKVNL